MVVLLLVQLTPNAKLFIKTHTKVDILFIHIIGHRSIKENTSVSRSSSMLPKGWRAKSCLFHKYQI